MNITGREAVMLDLETLGTKPGSVILAIGAVAFSKHGIADTYYQVVDTGSCIEAGLYMDVETVVWWMQQGEAARRVFKEGGCSLYEALHSFKLWLPESATIWGNGAAFDNVLMADAYSRVMTSPGWSYRRDRCYRTVSAMYPQLKIQRSGVAHNALDDARSQAEHLRQLALTFNFELS